MIVLESIKEIVDEELESYNEDSETQFELQPNEDRIVELLATNVRYDDDETTLFLPVKRLRKQKAKETTNDTPIETPNEVVEETIEEEQEDYGYEIEFKVISKYNKILYRKEFLMTLEEENDEWLLDDNAAETLERVKEEVAKEVALHFEKMFGKGVSEEGMEKVKSDVETIIFEKELRADEKNLREKRLKF